MGRVPHELDLNWVQVPAAPTPGGDAVKSALSPSGPAVDDAHALMAQVRPGAKVQTWDGHCARCSRVEMLFPTIKHSMSRGGATVGFCMPCAPRNSVYPGARIMRPKPRAVR